MDVHILLHTAPNTSRQPDTIVYDKIVANADPAFISNQISAWVVAHTLYGFQHPLTTQPEVRASSGGKDLYVWSIGPLMVRPDQAAQDALTAQFTAWADATFFPAPPKKRGH